jgi:hypothetical protein
MPREEAPFEAFRQYKPPCQADRPIFECPSPARTPQVTKYPTCYVQSQVQLQHYRDDNIITTSRSTDMLIKLICPILERTGNPALSSQYIVRTQTLDTGMTSQQW